MVSVVVSVFCELASREPNSYLPLAPEFYRVLVDSRNNWVLIKVLKIFAKFAPLEPRLAKRIVEPIYEHMRRTGPKSLIFECIRTIVTSLSDYDSAVRLAVAKVQEFLVDDDPNLKYLGLQALSIIAPKHSWAVVENKEFVIKSLSDTDPNIKLQALHLVMAMVSEDNVAEICRVLLNYALKSDPEFCNEILGSVLATCSRNVYKIIVDFDWYVSVLGEMTRIPHCQKGEEIESQLIDIGMRVKDVRPELVHVGRDLLIDPALLGNPFLNRVLSAAAWVSGEYVEFSKNPIELMEGLLQPRTGLLPPSIRVVYIQSAFKVLIFCLHSYLFPKEAVASSSRACDLEPRVADAISQRGCPEGSNLATSEALARGSHEVEVPEMVRNVRGLIELVEQEIRITPIQNEGKFVMEKLKASEVMKLMHDAFLGELGPVSMSAQERVPIPDGLMLMENLNDLETVCGDVQLPTTCSFSLRKPHFEESSGSLFDCQMKKELEPSSESTSLLAEHCKRHGLYYLPSEIKETTSGDGVRIAADKPESKTDLISCAVREVLLGNEAIPTSSQRKPSDKLSSKTRGKEKKSIVHPLGSTVLLANAGNSEVENSSPRRSKHVCHGKGRKHRSPRKNVEGSEERSCRDKKTSGHRHVKNKARQRGDRRVNVVAQTSLIPDFLL
ncbi:delta-adaptin [Actinidia rufa]|uniref:Delta-adaptin n=1 Tax=Actinidia rufa TaxID=165716 RepID=A0A7J0DK64_9ERIC|nr:delta-adaptin [Actinidia rufa]